MRRAGYDLTRFNPKHNPVARLMAMIRFHEIDLVLDVGANDGHFASVLLENRYVGRIVSFEPQTDAFSRLVSKSNNVDGWECRNIALGSENHVSTINVSENSVSSSILDMLPEHEIAAPGSGYSGKEQIEVKSLDSIWNELNGRGRKAWLKIDTQGYEMEVLRGATASLAVIEVVQMEMSLVELYGGSPSFMELLEYVLNAGYEIASFEPGFTDAVSGRVLQVDGIFIRKK